VDNIPVFLFACQEVPHKEGWGKSVTHFWIVSFVDRTLQTLGARKPEVKCLLTKTSASNGMWISSIGVNQERRFVLKLIEYLSMVILLILMPVAAYTWLS